MFKNSVKAARERLGWSQYTLSELSGVSRDAIHRIENDPTNSPLQTVMDKLDAALKPSGLAVFWWESRTEERAS